jgi:hypothetical protein
MKRFQAIILTGFFLILITGSVEFYGQINEVPIDPDYPLFLLYIGIPHNLSGMPANIEKLL